MIIDIETLEEEKDPFTDPIDADKPEQSRAILTRSSGRLHSYVLDVQDSPRSDRPFHLIIKEEGIETPEIPQQRSFQIIRLPNGALAEQTRTGLKVQGLPNPEPLILDQSLSKRALCPKCTKIDLQHFETGDDVVEHHETFQRLARSAGICPLCAMIMNSLPHKDSLVYDENRSIIIRAANDRHHPDYVLGLGLSSLLIDFPTIEHGHEHLSAVRQSTLHLVADYGSQAAIFGDVNGRRVWGGLDLKPVTKWLSQCIGHHAKCVVAHRRPRNALFADKLQIPGRLLDVGFNDFDLLKLVDAKPYHRKPYLALSYRWGEAVSVITNSSNYNAHQKAIDVETLCRVFRDAIHITRKLGYRYIWIDALCIIQDSPEDLERELPLMGHIYSNATITLAASVSQSAETGLLHGRQRVNEIRLPYRTRDGLSFGEVFVTDGNPCGFDEDVTKGALSQRAWCLQERAMSTRILHFGKDQLFWECLTGVWAEDSSLGLRAKSKTTDAVSKFRDAFRTISEDIDQAKAAVRSRRRVHLHSRFGLMEDRSHMTQLCNRRPYGPWYELVEQYTKRAMTHESDKLPALVGLATKFAEHIGNDEYVAGLWREDILAGLLWSAGNFHQWAVKHVLSSSTHRAPSWSWASVDGAVGYPDGFICHYTVEVLDVQVQLLRAKLPVVATLDRPLRLVGRTLPLSQLVGFRPEDESWMTKEREKYKRLGPFRMPHAIFDNETDAMTWEMWLRAARNEPTENRYFALLVASIGCGSTTCDHYANCDPRLGYALLMSPWQDGSYRRIGLAQVKVEQFLTEAEQDEIVIV